MSLYIVGDVHGCIETLEQCLNRAGFDPVIDKLWSVGDLVGKGPGSLEVLRLVESLGDSFNMVLGNHEVRLLSLLAGGDGPAKALLQPVLKDKGSIDWKSWLRQKPLMLRDQKRGVTMTHAGIFPGWSLPQAERYACQSNAQILNASDSWLRQLAQSPYKRAVTEADAWRDIVNAFTEMRYCNISDPNRPTLDFTCKSPLEVTGPLVPWFELWSAQSELWVFGHWSDLQGATGRADIRCLDTGCVYGRSLSVLKVAADGTVMNV